MPFALRKSQVALLACLLFLGCRSEEPIAVYDVPKETTAAVSATGGGADRMLAAIVLEGNQAWFFKLTGPEAGVAKVADGFRSFAKSIQFQENGQPKWTLPDGWQQQAGQGMRFATIVVPTPEKPLDLTVIALPIPGGGNVGGDGGGEGHAEYLLSNVNRWRQQLSIPAASKVEEDTETIEADGRKIILVDLTGTADPHAGMTGGGGPFSGGAPSSGGAPLASPPPAAAAPASGGAEFQYKVPSGWQEQPSGGPRLAAFKIGSDDKGAEVTVITLGGAAGGFLANVNRWRDQIGLEPTDMETLDKETKKIQVGGESAEYVELLPADLDQGEAILAAAVTCRDKTWFFKLKGNANLAQAERDNFRTFLESVTFP